MVDNLEDEKKKWPADFKQEADDFIELLGSKAVKATSFKVSEFLKTAEDVLKARKPVFRAQLLRLRNALTARERELDAVLTQAVDVRGGARGIGSEGEKNGQPGKKGTWAVQSTRNVAKVLSSDVCYAHPVQCQMLLDKAHFLYFCGSLQDKAKSASILERLQRRLAPFEKCPEGSSEPPLWKAYRQAEDRLYIVKEPQDGEPFSIRRLRAIRADATTTLQHLFSQRDFYGKSPGEVPRGSYIFYKKTADSFLTHLKEVEEIYLKYFNASKDAAAQLNTIRKRAQICDASKELNRQLIKEAVTDIQKTTRTVEMSVDSVKSARTALLKSMKKVPDVIQGRFGVKFEDVISAVGQVLFVHGSLPMVALQTASVLHQGQENALQDDGVPVKKDYLIRKLHTITGDVKSLTEGYKVLQDGNIKLDDPGAEKLLVEKAKWDNLIDDFSNALSTQIYEDVKKKFNAYLGKFDLLFPHHNWNQH